MSHSTSPAVAVVGAGPYGLSIAAQLRASGVEFRIFGTPMQQWREHMPRGMFLKSEGFASNLFDAGGSYTLKQYCNDEALPYAGYAAPVSLQVFVEYGLAFQRRFVPNVENEMVASVNRISGAFELKLASGETLRAGKVVIATGMSNTAYIPARLARLPSQAVSHSSHHHELSSFKGRDVTVIGGGQSACEVAALLHEAGVTVRLLVRPPALRWNETPATHARSHYERLRRPMSKLGPGLGPWLYSNAPMLFCHLPRSIRRARVQKALGPAGAWWLRNRVMGRLAVMPGHTARAADTSGDRVRLQLEAEDGKRSELMTDHVIAAIGFRFALSSLPFLSERFVSQLRSMQQIPLLSRNFESSVPGLYFTGLASAEQFGPSMRFLHGADYTARRVSTHISRGRDRSSQGFPPRSLQP
jgi:FAD-dependent urate hydroxylase